MSNKLYPDSGLKKSVEINNNNKKSQGNNTISLNRIRIATELTSAEMLQSEDNGIVFTSCSLSRSHAMIDDTSPEANCSQINQLMYQKLWDKQEITIVKGVQASPCTSVNLNPATHPMEVYDTLKVGKCTRHPDCCCQSTTAFTLRTPGL